MNETALEIRIKRLETFIKSLVDYLQVYLEEGNYHMAQGKAREIANQIDELEYMKDAVTFRAKVDAYADAYADAYDKRIEGGE